MATGNGSLHIKEKIMGKIYTRSGDKGTTGIHSGIRVPKDDIRIEANGTLDELNAVIGVVRSQLPAEHPWQEDLLLIQREMMTLMSLVATPHQRRENNPNRLDDNLIGWCEEKIDKICAKTTDNGYFVLPGGTPAAAFLHLARTVARRAERRLWSLHKSDQLPEQALAFVNRLSDLFFVMARLESQGQGCPEERWKSFAYKSKRKKDGE